MGAQELGTGSKFCGHWNEKEHTIGQKAGQDLGF